VTAERMVPRRWWDERFHGSPDGISHFRVERAHNDEGPPRVVVGWLNTPILSGSTQRLVDVLFASSLTYSLVMGPSPKRAASYFSRVLRSALHATA